MLVSSNECFHPVTLSSSRISQVSLIIEPESMVVQTQSTIPNEDDPLIDRQWERIDYIATFLIVFLLIIGFGLLSRQIEYALILAILTTLLIVGIILFI
jgi:hypothetical protein